MLVSGVRTEDVPQVWPDVAHLLYPAVAYAHGSFTMEKLYKALTEKEGLYNVQLWVGYEPGQKAQIAWVTRIRDNKQELVCDLLFLGGKGLMKVMRYFPWIMDWARSNGCTAMETHTRKQLVKLWKKYGFQFVASTKWGEHMFRDLKEPTNAI